MLHDIYMFHLIFKIQFMIQIILLILYIIFIININAYLLSLFFELPRCYHYIIVFIAHPCTPDDRHFVEEVMQMKMPNDFFSFWDYCVSVDEFNPLGKLQRVFEI